MTNEQIAEEIWYEAYQLGIVEELRGEVKKLSSNLPRHTPYSEIVYDAYHQIKKNLTEKQIK